MTTPNFSELLAKYMQRAGISDSELARSIGVQRQTIFRWKEGIVARPRVREDILRCASKLRLTPAERDQLLLAGGFPPENLPQPSAADEPPADDVLAPTPDKPPAVELTFTANSPTVTTVESPFLAVEKLPASRWPGGRWVSLTLVGLLLVAAGLIGTRVLRLPDLGQPTSTAASALIRSDLQFVNSTPPPPPATSTLSATGGIAPVGTQAVLLWPTAAPAEMLLVVAPFTGHSAAQFDVASRIEEKLQEQIDQFSLTNTRVRIWSDSLPDKVAARQVLTMTQATIVIWGAYDDGRVQVNWLVRNAEKAEKSDFSLTLPQDLTVTINENVPKEVQSIALYTFGRLFQSQGNAAQAQRAYQQGLSANPNNDGLAALLNFYLARLISTDENQSNRLERLKAYEAAVNYYTAAYERNPRLYNALYNRGTVWLNRALVLTHTAEISVSLTAAVADLTELIAQKPDFANAYFNRGLAYYYRDHPLDQTKAIADFTEVTVLNPTGYAGWYQRALSSIRAGDDLSWPDDLTHTLTLSPTYYAVYDAFCWGYALAQQPQVALPYCRQATATQLEQTAANRTSHDALGIIYAQLGRYPEAIAALEKYRLWVQTYHVQEYQQRRGPEVEDWIITLQAQQNPFTTEVLDSLR